MKKEGKIMKTLITTLNSKFIHSSLSIRYLKSYCRDISNIEIAEFTINQNTDFITSEIYKSSPNIVCFSCYIWNIGNTLDICERLKIVKPDVIIVLGGPEVSFDGEDVLSKYPFVDFIVSGEGEVTFRELILNIINCSRNFYDIKGLVFRDGKKIVTNSPRPLIEDLDTIPSPYEFLNGDLKDKIVYFESSRGCPFNCQFCLSSTIKGVRFFSLDRVKKDLDRLINLKVRQVKFVDRTFNAKKEYAMEIIKFIMDKNPENMNFHFEITAHLIDDDMLNLISHSKEGLFQFEIGVQSTNPNTIDAIGRTTNIEKVEKITRKIKSYKNIHQHLDLIAGLPYENYESFKQSFNDIYSLRPEKLQLGFLKLLKGSRLREEKDKYGFKFIDRPPYEVLENNYISYSEMLKLKAIEDLVEKYGNDSSFENITQFIITNYYESPFEFYEAFSAYWEQKGYHKVSHSKKELYRIIYDFFREVINSDVSIINEIIKFDFILNNKNPNIPEYINRVDVEILQDKKHEFLKNEMYVEKFLPKFKDIPVKKIINTVHVESFEFDVIYFINYGYNMKEIIKRKTTVLFVYETDKVLNKCKVFDITEDINQI